MAREWQTFVRKFEDLKEGRAKLFIKDLAPGPRKYDTRFVEAQIAKSNEVLPDGDPLYLRSESGLKRPEPWYIKVIQELPPFVPGKPWEDVYDAIKRTEWVHLPAGEISASPFVKRDPHVPLSTKMLHK